MLSLLTIACSAALLTGSGPTPSAGPAFSRRHAALLLPFAFGASAPTAALADAGEDAERAAAEKAERKRRYEIIRRQRMAAEARAQSEAYQERMASKGLESTIGSNVLVGQGRTENARDLGMNPSNTVDAAIIRDVAAASDKADVAALEKLVGGQ